MGCGFGYLFLLNEGNFILLYWFVGKCEFLRVLFVLNLLGFSVVSLSSPNVALFQGILMLSSQYTSLQVATAYYFHVKTKHLRFVDCLANCVFL